MFQLVDTLVPVNRVDLSEWTLDERQASVVEIKPLGSAGLPQTFPRPIRWRDRTIIRCCRK